MNGAALKACRFIALILSAVLTLVASILLIIALATPSWLVVQYRLSNGGVEEHRHGLWLDCVLRGANYYSMQTNYFPSYGNMGDQCEYKWVNVDQYGGYGGGGSGMVDPYNYGGGGGNYYGMSTMFENDFAQHRFLGWHVTILVMLLIAITAGIFSLISSCCVLWTGLCSPVVALLEFIAFLCSAIGAIVFFVNANRPDIRYVQIPTSAERWRINEQVRGFSFDLCIAGVIIFLLAFLVGVFSTVTVFMNAHRDHQRRRHIASKTYPKTDIATVSSHNNDNGTFVRAHSPAIDV